VSLLINAILAVFAYIVSIFLYIFSYKAALAPSGPLIDESSHVAFQFVIIVLICSGLLVFIVRSSVDAQTRVFSFFTASFLIGISLLRAFHVIGLDPNAPAETIVRTVLGPLAPYYTALLHQFNR
jgi:hypothetical protein